MAISRADAGADAGWAPARELMDDPGCGWSLGTDGALGEFMRGSAEAADIDISDAGGRVVTVRGALAVDFAGDVLVRAYEAVSGCGTGWSQGVLFCLPESRGRRAGRRTLTEIGPDREAARAGDRAAVLFDLGLGSGHSDFCARIADPALIEGLRGCAGRSVFDPGNPAIGLLKAASPARVVISNLGRIEVYQDIPPTTPGARTPAGPHTHLLPRLLARGRGQGPAIPAPAGYLPCLAAHPAHPASDQLGRSRPFEAAAHARFQALLGRFGGPDYVACKRQIDDAMSRRRGPPGFGNLDPATVRLAVAVALCQYPHLHGGGRDLSEWRAL